jgi:hypothetical protein
VPGGEVPDKITLAGKGALKITGAVNVVEQEVSPRPYSPSWDVSLGRKCRARNLIECEGDHVLLQCSKLLSRGLDERKEVLESSGLCLFCLKHAAELEFKKHALLPLAALRSDREHYCYVTVEKSLRLSGRDWQLGRPPPVEVATILLAVVATVPGSSLAWPPLDKAVVVGA